MRKVLPMPDCVIRTRSGRLLNPIAPDPDAIVITDIAHALSQLCRFGGHTSSPFSVAQHSVAVSEAAAKTDPLAGMWGLLHDASEAYIVDIPRPVKMLPQLDGYREAERTLQDAIYAKFGCVGIVPPAVHQADDLQLAIEFRDLMPARPGDMWHVTAWGAATIYPMPPPDAALLFLERFLLLQEEASCA